ncbi:hypothetical protein A2642_04990 [Candidatus Nomurabacteria bacterium RIFCSPHIGHO2_01_FULL_39_10]|uniref:Phosphoribosyltransferase domain-containing protein n=1 Tax=Candidatus Nomurabacteria bacterium RIFCSPHIGHO2_01_FULL_39_10 TaxID=1801733 RepID=A0A1F6V8U1_9BACT|nr:MAG: hypothetical protein A2642_04990 [Candidatus Nomurabacteria bacterium RIFCSPHIGHO2_01_FULL_39_10]
MTYQSPFDALYNTTGKGSLEYNGTLDDVLSVLTESAFSQSLTTQPDIWALHPPRILRAIIDYKIGRPELPNVEQLLKDAINITLDIYVNPQNTTRVVEALKDEIQQMQLQDLLTTPLTQPLDPTTWEASTPKRSQKTAHRLKKTTSADLLFIALGQGGIAAGMDVYLRYCALTGSTNSAFYVARLSRLKLKDTRPKLTVTEIQYLQKEAQGKEIVIFDEDKSSGATIYNARYYFSTKVFPTQNVITITNFDKIRELHKKWYEKLYEKIIK